MAFSWRPSVLEALFLQVIFYIACFFYNDYLALLLGLIIGSIGFFILIISWLVELIEASRISRKYFQYMATVAVAPLLGVGFMMMLFGVDFERFF